MIRLLTLAKSLRKSVLHTGYAYSLAQVTWAAEARHLVDYRAQDLNWILGLATSMQG